MPGAGADTGQSNDRITVIDLYMMAAVEGAGDGQGVGFRFGNPDEPTVQFGAGHAFAVVGTDAQGPGRPVEADIALLQGTGLVRGFDMHGHGALLMCGEDAAEATFPAMLQARRVRRS